MDFLLELICAGIQLTDTQYESTEDHYDAVTTGWLRREVPFG